MGDEEALARGDRGGDHGGEERESKEDDEVAEWEDEEFGPLGGVDVGINIKRRSAYQKNKTRRSRWGGVELGEEREVGEETVDECREEEWDG